MGHFFEFRHGNKFIVVWFFVLHPVLGLNEFLCGVFYAAGRVCLSKKGGGHVDPHQRAASIKWE
jgi:hypothetical protein